MFSGPQSRTVPPPEEKKTLFNFLEFFPAGWIRGGPTGFSSLGRVKSDWFFEFWRFPLLKQGLSHVSPSLARIPLFLPLQDSFWVTDLLGSLGERIFPLPPPRLDTEL